MSLINFMQQNSCYWRFNCVPFIFMLLEKSVVTTLTSIAAEHYAAS
jgi:hypothetical protein